MSTGNINLDIIIDKIKKAELSGLTLYKDEALSSISKYFDVDAKKANDLYLLTCETAFKIEKKPELIVTAPTSFSIKEKSTKNKVIEMISGATEQIIITGYSLSDYFEDVVDILIEKSKKGVLVKFFANNLDGQDMFEKLSLYKGKFLQIYNYDKSDDKMAALHAKVISVDSYKTLITSANLSYHGQQGNIEMGTFIESKDLAKSVDEFFTSLVFLKVFENCK